jgi:hypothetical protein
MQTRQREDIINVANHSAEMDFTTPAEVGRAGVMAGIVGVVSLIILIAGTIGQGDKHLFFSSYLVALIFWCGPAIGCLGMLMLQHVITGSWGLVVRRVLEAATRTLPFVALLFIPVFVEMFTSGHLYHWVHANGDEIILRKQPYLTPFFFIVRWAIYFGYWIILATLLNRWSKQQDETGSLTPLRNANRLSGPGIVFFVFAVTFASVDWVMSLDPHWYSTIFGFLYLINWLITAWTFVIATMYWLAKREPMNQVMNPRHFHDIGKLILAFVMLWAYLTLSQYLITWSGNLPEETAWYLRRGSGVWDVLIKFLVVLHFALPFLLLLSRDLKRNAGKLAGVVLLVFLMRMYDVFWTVWPEVSRHGSHGHEPNLHGAWTVIPALLGLGGIWIYLFTRELGKHPLMPPRDPKLEEALTTGWHGH